MPHTIKIATCNYCGTRTMLKPTARDGHELACSSCGAPLHEMKWLKAPEPAAAPKRKAKKPARPKRPEPYEKPRKSYKRKKRRKSLLSEVVEEIWDFAEDIFD